MNVDKSKYDNLSELSLAQKYFLSESNEERQIITKIFRDKLELKSYQDDLLVEIRIKDILLKAKLSKPEHEGLISGLLVFSFILFLLIIAYALMTIIFNYKINSTIFAILAGTFMINEFVYSCFSGIVRGGPEFNKIEDPITYVVLSSLYLISGLIFCALPLVL